MDFERDELPPVASDDFGYVAHHSFGDVLYRVQPEGLERNLLHNPKVVFDERALPIASAVMAHVATKWLEEHA